MKECPKCGSKYGDNNSNYCIDCGSRLFDLNSSKKPTSNIGKHKKRGQYKTGDYARDLRIAEELYKIYDKNSVARLDNVNGHLLAAQTRKMDILIEQNNRIISLLEKITNKPYNSDSIDLIRSYIILFVLTSTPYFSPNLITVPFNVPISVFIFF